MASVTAAESQNLSIKAKTESKEVEAIHDYHDEQSTLRKPMMMIVLMAVT